MIDWGGGEGGQIWMDRMGKRAKSGAVQAKRGAMHTCWKPQPHATAPKRAYKPPCPAVRRVRYNHSFAVCGVNLLILCLLPEQSLRQTRQLHTYRAILLVKVAIRLVML